MIISSWGSFFYSSITDKKKECGKRLDADVFFVIIESTNESLFIY